MEPHTMLLRFVVAYLLCSDVRGWFLADRLSGRVPIPRIHTYRKATTGPSSSTKEDQQKMLSFMDAPIETTVGDINAGEPLDDDLLDFVKCIVKAADGRKAEDIVALKVEHVTTLASVLVILSGNSRPQNQAITAAIQKDVKESYGMIPGGNGVPEGNAESGWMLLDYGSVMVHIMTPKSRLYYNVEGQWRAKGGVELDISSVLIPNKMDQPDTATLGVEDAFVAEEDDPFWS